MQMQEDDQVLQNWQGKQLGSYRLVSLVGRGGFAQVYLGEHVHLQTRAAIKVLQERLSRQDQESFLAEAQMIARLHHPNIIQVLEFGIEESIPYLVMDYAPGGTLRQRYHAGVMLTPLRILPYLQQLANALQFAHEQRIVHRDVKPENMLFGSNDELLLADFGIAQGVQSSRSQSMEDMAGTVSYMAPELLQGRAVPAGDQYALAVVIYEWLSGSPPFRGTFVEVASQHLFAPPPPLRQAAVSHEVEQVVLTALSKDPGKRYASIQEFAVAFERAMLMSTVEETIKLDPRQRALLYSARQDTEPEQIAEAQQTGTSTSINGGVSTGPLPTLPASSQENVASPMPTIAAAQSVPVVTIASTVPSLPDKEVIALAPANSLPTIQSFPKRPRHLGLMIASIIVLFIFLIGEMVGGGYFLLLHLLAPATTTAQPPGAWNVTNVSDKQAQALYNQVTGKKPTYVSTMATNDAYNWVTASISEGSCSFADGAYHTRTVKAGPIYPMECIAMQPSFSDFAFQTQITITKGDSGGVVFRAASNKGSANVYFFGFDKEGVYSLLVAPKPTYLLLLHSSTAITTGLNHPNLLTVITQGASTYLYINRHYVGSVTDSVSEHGYLGFYAESLSTSTGSTEVICNMVQIWKITTKLAM